ncbi:MAG: RsmE family RNA methyltransferase, partial [Oceanicaulis sp.]
MTVEPRLHLDAPFSAGARLDLDKDQAHYLVNVMRRSAGDTLRVFNGEDGEWRAEIAEAGKRRAALTLVEQTRAQTAAPDLHLFFSPVKKARTDFIVEKATELGASAITPVMTRRTMADRVRTDRLQALVREAAEQTERLDLPGVGEPVSLVQMLKGWDDGRHLIFCDEAGDEASTPWGGEAGRAAPILEALTRYAPHSTPGLPSRGGREAESASVHSSDATSFSPVEVSTRGRNSPPFPSGGEGAKSGPRDRTTARTGGESANARKWAILIGPEGGFDPEERPLLRGQAFVVPVTLGPRILRADTAVAAAMSVWQA